MMDMRNVICVLLISERQGEVTGAKKKERANKRVQSDAASRSGIGAKFGYVTRLELGPISVTSRRG
jgi:hypothetical protein